MDIGKVEKFILQDYEKSGPELKCSISSLLLTRGLLSFPILAFFWGFGAFLLSLSDINLSSNFLILGILLIPITLTLSAKHYRQRIIRMPDEASEKPEQNSKMRYGLGLIIALSSLPFLVGRMFPNLIVPLVFFDIMALILILFGFVILFLTFGLTFYRLYLIKRYCPYLRNFEDRRYYGRDESEAETETESDDT